MTAVNGIADYSRKSRDALAPVIVGFFSQSHLKKQQQNSKNANTIITIRIFHIQKNNEKTGSLTQHEMDVRV